MTLYARAVQIELYSKRVMALCAALIALSAFLYGAFMLIAVERTAARAKAQAQIESLSDDLASLQGQYLAAAQELTPARAAALGFVQPRAIATVFVSTADHALTLNNGRR